MKWILSSELDAFNLAAFFHIWIEKCPNGYFLMGELIHNGEEVVLSETFSEINKCKNIIMNFSHTPCAYDHWQEDALCYCDKCNPYCPICKNERVACVCMDDGKD